METRRDFHEVVIRECLEHFERDKKYWNRMIFRGTRMSGRQLLAKEVIIETVFDVAASAALKTTNAGMRELLMWDYRELKAIINDYRRMVPRNQ